MTDQALSVPTAPPSAASPPLPPSPPGASADVNRYPGSPPFGDSEVDRLLFRGRTRETDEVLHSILSYDLLLVYAVSGLGKTSLLTAGVLQPLRERDYFPVIIRLNAPGTPFVRLIDTQIRDAGAAADGVVVSRNPGAGDGDEAPSTLWDLLAGLEIWRGNVLQHLVLVFDQFEELFTLGWSTEERERFIEEFGAVVRRHRSVPDGPSAPPELPPPNVKITLLIREDFLGQLEALAVQVPQIMQHRFRLEGLSPDQASAAIREPAGIDDPRLRTRRFTYSVDAAEAILTFLRTKEERGRAVLTPSIDPSQLQIICQHIERSILPAKAVADRAEVEITADDLGGRDGLERIVGDFYRREIEDFPLRQRTSLRKLCETGLISQSGRRLSLEEGEIFAEYQVGKATLADLVDRRLLRSEPRVGSVYYELAHDTLTAPILAYRDEKRRVGRRRRLIAALAVGGVAAAVLIAVAVFTLARDDATSEATPLELGTSASGTVDVPGESVDYAFEVTTDQPLLVQVRPGAELNAVLDVTDADGFRQSVDASSTGQPETLVLTTGAIGRYVVEVGGYRSSVGDYALEVTQPGASTVDVGEVVPASAGAGQVSVFAFDATPGQDLVIKVLPYDRLDAQVELIDPSGDRVGALVDDTGAGEIERVVLTDPSPGRYQMLVYAYRSTSGSYDLSVEAVDVVEVPVGETVAGRLGGTETVAAFEFVAPDPGLLAVDVVADGDGLFYPVLAVTAPHGGSSQPVDDGSGQLVLVEGGADGRYLATVESSDGTPGTFTMSVRPVDVVELTAAAARSTRTASGLAVVDFNAADGELLAVEVTPADRSDVNLVVTGPGAYTGEVVAGSEGRPVTALVDVPVGGTYRAVVRSTSAATPVRVAVGPAAVDPLDLGAPVAGTLSGPGAFAVYEFEATDDRPLEVELTADDDAVDVEVIDPAGLSTWAGVEATGSEGGIVVDSGPGSYRAIVRSHETLGGPFELAVRPIEVVDVAVGGGPTPIHALHDVVAFDFDAPADDALALSVTPELGPALQVDVTGPGGTAVGTGYPSAGRTTSLIVEGAEAGRHRALVTGAGLAGSLAVRVRPLDAVGLDLGQRATGTIDATADLAVYDVDVAAPGGGPLLVTVVPADGLRTNVEVDGPDGSVQFGNESSDSGVVNVVVAGDVPGRYRTVVRSDDSVGTFDIEVQAVEATGVAAGAEAAGAISGPGDAIVRDLEITDEGPFALDVTPSDGLDAVVTIVDPSGVTTRTNAGGVDVAEVTEFGGVTGRYRVVISGPSAGDFTMSVQPVRAETVAIGDTVDGAISGPSDIAVFELDATDGDGWSVDVDPDNDFDVILTVIDPSDMSTQVDTGGSGDRETFDAPTGSGRYRFVISSYGGTFGEFELAVSD